jgi:hypothetical protein
MRPDLWEPEDTLDPELLSSVLELVSVHIPPEQMMRWTRLELLLAYDWAWRRYMRASDNLNHEREKPWFVSQAQLRQKQLDEELFKGSLKRAQES